MAAVQFSGGKCHGAAEAKAMMRHADADERLKHEHSNKDIDKSKTELNTSLYDLSYKEMCDLYDQRVQQYQSNATRKLRSDAVTLLDAIVSVPADMNEMLQDLWISDVVDIINKHYKADVVLDAKIHRDEIHDYVDPTTHKTVQSRVHAHIFIFPEINEKLNCRDFTNRQNMTSLNREIDKMTRDRYYCKFLTGEQTVDRDFLTVEQLKRASDNAELEKQTHKLKTKKQDAAVQLSAIQKLLDDTEQQLQKVSAQLQQLEANKRNNSISIKKQRYKLNKLHESISDAQQNFKSLVVDRNTINKNDLLRISEAFPDQIEDLRRCIAYEDQFDMQQQLTDEQLEDYFSTLEKYHCGVRSDICCYVDDRKTYESEYEYYPDDEDLEL